MREQQGDDWVVLTAKVLSGMKNQCPEYQGKRQREGEPSTRS